MHLNEVAWEYRVRPDSMISGVNMYTKVMDDYLFTKPELAPLGHIRSDVHRLLNIEQSMEYRLGKVLLGPVRRVLERAQHGRNRTKPDLVREPMTAPNRQK